MAQQNIRHVEEVIEVAPESPIGTAGTWSRVAHMIGSFDDGRTTEQLDPLSASTDLFDRDATIDGFKRAAPGWKMRPRAPGTQLDAAAAGGALALATTCPNLLVPSWIMGGVAIAAGSAVVASPAPTATSCSVTPAGGANFLAGTVCLVEIGTPGSGNLELNVVATRSTDALTWALAFSNAPQSGAKVINAINLFFNPSNTQSFAVRESNQADANEQYLYTKCTGDFELTYTRGQLLEMAVKCRAGTWSGPSSTVFGSLPTYSADIHGNKGFALKDAVTLLQPVATTTRTQYRMTNLAISMKQGMVHTEEHGTDGIDSVMRTGDRDLLRVTITGPLDRTLETYATSKTPLRLLHWVPQGSGNTMKGWFIHVPRCYIEGTPKRKITGGIAQVEYTLAHLIDPTLTTALLKSPIVFGSH